jgi:hypothetical protein
MKRCRYCGAKMPGAHPNRQFCCQKHKDRYHNENNPRGYFAHLSKEKRSTEIYDDDGDAYCNSDFGDSK